MADLSQLPLSPSSQGPAGGAALRLVPTGRAAASSSDLLLDAIGRLHGPDDLPTLQVVAVEAVERLLPGAAAALFVSRVDSTPPTLCASGPSWRTAERDGPAWLPPLCATMAEMLRADTRMAGRLVRGRDDGGPDLALVPLGADDDRRHALVVAWPPHAQARTPDLGLLDRFAPLLAGALHRVVAIERWRAAASAMREAQAELVSSHAERAAASVAGGAAHDLNQALSVLLGVSGVLLACDALDPQARGDVEAVQAAARSVARLAQRLAFIGRAPRAGAPELVDLRALACRAAERVRAEREPSSVEPPFRLDSPVDRADVLAVAGDLSDAVTALLRLHADAAVGRARLEVIDGEVALITEGPAVAGFPEAEPGATSYAPATRWRGPVLAACRRLARAHGWRFAVEPVRPGRQRVVLALRQASDVGADASFDPGW